MDCPIDYNSSIGEYIALSIGRQAVKCCEWDYPTTKLCNFCLSYTICRVQLHNKHSSRYVWVHVRVCVCVNMYIHVCIHVIISQMRYKRRDYSIQVSLKEKDIIKANTKVSVFHFTLQDTSLSSMYMYHNLVYIS